MLTLQSNCDAFFFARDEFPQLFYSGKFAFLSFSYCKHLYTIGMTQHRDNGEHFQTTTHFPLPIMHYVLCLGFFCPTAFGPYKQKLIVYKI